MQRITILGFCGLFVGCGTTTDAPAGGTQVGTSADDSDAGSGGEGATSHSTQSSPSTGGDEDTAETGEATDGPPDDDRVVYLEETFENGSVDGAPTPLWSWPTIESSAVPNGFMYGERDIYWVDDVQPHRGSYALRLDFTGRNGWCNICGAESVSLPDAGATCVSGTNPPFANYIYNRDNGFSRWQVTSANGAEVCFAVEGPTGESLHEVSGFGAGDDLRLPYVCGTNGVVGGSPGRRSDCNKAINYLDTAGTTIEYGAALSRRFFAYIPSATTMPGITFKLGYSHWRHAGAANISATTLKVSVQRDNKIELTLPNGESFLPDFWVGTDDWYYFEEVFHRESAQGASDASYELYVARRGEESAEPLVAIDMFELGEFVDMSFMGNWQHNNDATGLVYFDDVLISDRYAGAER